MAGSYSSPVRDNIKALLDLKVKQYNCRTFIDSDPIQVPHDYEDPRDIEIAAFFTSVLAWGRKTSIISSARKLLNLMPGGPYEFVCHAGEREMERLLPFVHRTFNGLDAICFIQALRHIYQEYGGPYEIFKEAFIRYADLEQGLLDFRTRFFEKEAPGRSAKHLADISKGAAAKRLNMFLRWMVRQDRQGVDFGIWPEIPMSALYIPLDVHTGSVARKLGLLTRKQNDWKAVQELTGKLRVLNPEDPVSYDFALFGLGSFEAF